MTGIKKQPDGSWRVYGKVNGQAFWKRFPAGTSVPDLRAWREAKFTELRYGVPIVSDAGGFREDAGDYLDLIQHMPSRKDRERHIREWIAVFGNTPRAAIAPIQIRRALEQHRQKGAAASTLNHRRTALLHFFTVTNGKSGANPVRDVPPYPEHSEDVLRAHDYSTIYRLLIRMAPSKTRTRLWLLAFTGWPHAQIMRLEPGDIDLARKRVLVRRRRKGKGAAGRWIPIVLPQTEQALRWFVEENCFGPFSQASMRKSLLLARDASGARMPITPYHLRHSFGTLLALFIEDERALQELLLCSLKQVRRYTAAATDPRVRQALERVLGPMASGEAFRQLRMAVGNGATSKPGAILGRPLPRAGQPAPLLVKRR